MSKRCDVIYGTARWQTKIFLCVCSVIIGLTMFGCTIKRTVKDNQLYSSYPDVKINVDKSYKFLGSGNYEVTGTYADMKYEYFYFIPANDADDKTLASGIVVEIGMPKQKAVNNMYFYTVVDDFRKNILSHNRKAINHSLYESYTVSTGLPIASQISRFSMSKGYMPPQCGLTQVIIVSGIDTFKTIKYYEDIALSGLSCDRWADRDKLTPEQRKYLDGFIKRADASLQIISF